MVHLFIKHELKAEDFPHTTGTPINFSLNARSAVLFYQYSQTLGRKELADNPTSEFWLCTFRLECEHLAKIKEDKTLGLWNRLYIDHLLTTYNLQFTENEWSTFKCWTFSQKTGVFDDALNLEMLVNESPNLRRLHHCILPEDFYDENFKEMFDADYEVVTSRRRTFKESLLISGQTYQSLSLKIRRILQTRTTR